MTSPREATLSGAPDPAPDPALAIYVNCFGPAHTLDRPPFVPIQVGAALAEDDLGMVRDDGGDAISDRNARYCEMTGIYWVWRNVELPERVGFFHYRRFLDFHPEREREVTGTGLVLDSRVGGRLLDRYGLSAGRIGALLDGWDGALPKPFDVRSQGFGSVRAHYLGHSQHRAEHLDILDAVMAGRGALHARALREVMEGPTFYPNNMFVFDRSLFRDYCEWIFPILAELDERIDLDGLSVQQARAVGYIAERLMSVYLRVRELERRAPRLLELERVFVHDTAPLPAPVEPLRGDRPVLTVVASTDSNYVPHMAALIASLFEHVDPARDVHMVVLDGGMTAEQRRMMDRIKRLRPGSAISYVPMGSLFSALSAHTVFTRATFYRLALPDILPRHGRVLFLDTDLVVIDDPSPLIEVDLRGGAMAACEDLVMRAFVGKRARSLDLTGGVPAGAYLRDYLGIEPGTVYRQVGVLVMDLERLRETRVCERMIEDLAERTYWFLDQDVINRHLAAEMAALPPRWNVIHVDEAHRAALSEGERERYDAAHRNPGIVHYAGLGKPWVNDLNPYGQHYWSYLRQTPFYETVLFGYLARNRARRSRAPAPATQPRRAPSLPRRASRVLWRLLPMPVRQAFKPTVHWFNRHVWRSNGG